MVSHLAGRTYEDEHGTHANLYLVSLAPTGMGKDEPRLTNQKLADAIGALPSVPEYVYRSLSPKALTDGLMGRCLFIETDAFCRLGKMANIALPSQVVEAAKWMNDRELAYAKTGVYEPIVVRTTHEAQAAIDDMRPLMQRLGDMRPLMQRGSKCGKGVLALARKEEVSFAVRAGTP